MKKYNLHVYKKLFKTIFSHILQEKEKNKSSCVKKEEIEIKKKKKCKVIFNSTITKGAGHLKSLRLTFNVFDEEKKNLKEWFIIILILTLEKKRKVSSRN